MIKKLLFSITACSGFLISCSVSPTTSFIAQRNGRFEVNGKPYYYVGTNFWYGAILGSTGQGGNRERLINELDFMKANGITNLRVLVGADGADGQITKAMPALQVAPGVYNDTIFDGLDFLLAEMGKRDMSTVLYLNNTWDWSGGFAQYLRWTGYGNLPLEGEIAWETYLSEVSKYATCDSCHALFFNHVRRVINRTNRYTGKKYVDDPAILSWQVGNEPRALSKDVKAAFAKWLKEATTLIRSLDGNHLISIGSEGQLGCERDMSLFEAIHADPNVGYLTIHIWPKNWGWIKVPNVTDDLDTAIKITNSYIAEHIKIAEKLKKPLVVEEFGYPRDHHLYALSDSTAARDGYYANILNQVVVSSENGGVLAGCNFWAWGGFGRPAHERWQPWDDYLGDPAHEEQGLNAVFNTDATVKILKKYAEKIK
ncbi:MAG: cellulase family glycosylhydrolase [Prevotellaceae bacterium]|jgi:mannan endo-1,4-beta-mannosidase|nr:cellulase family glycosylhydrolase [Prevotellaceae bacterium]